MLTRAVTGPHAQHRIRRKALNPFFSKSQIIALWPYVLEKSEKLCSVLEDSYCNKTPLNLKKAYGCFGIDVVTEYAFGQCFNDLDKPGFESDLMRVMSYLLEKVHLITHIPMLRHGMNALPRSILEVVEPELAFKNKYQDVSCPFVYEFGSTC